MALKKEEAEMFRRLQRIVELRAIGAEYEKDDVE